MNLTLGIEEELMVVSEDTGDAVADPDPAIFETCVRNRGPHQVVNELLRSQIETGTRVCTSFAQLRASLYETRSIVIDGARRHGTAVIASSTHPFARWQEQRVTARRRYEEAEIEYQQEVRRFFVGGMHIHAGFGTPDLRIKVMTAIRPYLPLLLALSASSPFYSGQLTGLKSYRQSVIATLPRTGMPGPIHSCADYEAVVRRYRQVGAIRDPSEIRWDIRPSASYPTLELRICDICPRVEDAIAIAALYGCLIRHLARRIEAHAPPPPASEEWIEHSRWLAQRYGTLAFLPAGDPPRLVDIEDSSRELVAQLEEDADALRCRSELEHIGHIIRFGSSADRQEDIYRLRRLDGASHDAALKAVVDSVIDETEQAPDGSGR